MEEIHNAIIFSGSPKPRPLRSVTSIIRGPRYKAFKRLQSLMSHWKTSRKRAVPAEVLVLALFSIAYLSPTLCRLSLAIAFDSKTMVFRNRKLGIRGSRGEIDVLLILEELSLAHGWFELAGRAQEMALESCEIWVRRQPTVLGRLELSILSLKSGSFSDAEIHNRLGESSSHGEPVPDLSTCRFGIGFRQPGGPARKSKPSWEEFIAGRRVVIVGPAPDSELTTTLTNVGQNTVVCWLGSLSPQLLSGQIPRTYGITAAQSALALNGENSRALSADSLTVEGLPFSWIASKSGWLSPGSVSMRSTTVRGGVFVAGTPNLFQWLLMEVFAANPAEIFVAGVDFYSGRDFYSAESYHVAPFETGLGQIESLESEAQRWLTLQGVAAHNPSENRSFVKYLYSRDAIDGTASFRASLAHSNQTYLSLLENNFGG